MARDWHHLFHLFVNLPRGDHQRSSRAHRRRAGSRDAEIISAIGTLRPHGAQPQPLLSPREAEIIRLLIADRSCKEVAEVLHLSARTVEHYLDRLKLRFSKRTLHGLVGYIAHLSQLNGDFTEGNSPRQKSRLAGGPKVVMNEEPV